MDEWVRDEQELVRRCREGSEAAYAALVRLHRPRLYGIAYRLVGDRETAEDVLQETFLAAFKAIERFEPKPSLSPWLNTICVRLAGRTASRRASRAGTSLQAYTDDDSGELSLPGGAGTDQAADPHAAAEAAEIRRALAAAIAELPFNQRAAVTLRFVSGLDYAEAAQAMDVPLNTFKSHLLRGTRRLRELLGDSIAAIGPAEGTAVAGAAPDGEVTDGAGDGATARATGDAAPANVPPGVDAIG